MEDFLDDLVQRIADLQLVRAVVMTGSRTSGVADQDSDIDLVVYVDGDITAERREIAADFADQREPVLVNVDPFGSGDVWRARGTWIDMVFWSPAWADDQLDRVLLRHEPSLGYSTAFWRSIATAKPLFERTSGTHTCRPGPMFRTQRSSSTPFLASTSPGLHITRSHSERRSTRR